MSTKRKEIKIEDLEIAKIGFANGISTQLAEVLKTEHRSLNQEEKSKIIDEAALHYGNFLKALGCNWDEDPNSDNTPKRVSKAYVNDLWKGRYEVLDVETSFPSDGYSGIVLEKNVPLTSQCSHHHQTIKGVVHIAYIPGKDGTVVGLSKLNRIVEQFGRRGAIQEQLTVAIHNAVSKICSGNIGVMVVIEASHQCVSCRGVKHQGAGMVTSEVSGVFSNHEKTAKQEVLSLIK
jgi:GTP cyclohydrolase I